MRMMFSNMLVQCVPEDIDLPQSMSPSAAAVNKTKLGTDARACAPKEFWSNGIPSPRKNPLMNRGVVRACWAMYPLTHEIITKILGKSKRGLTNGGLSPKFSEKIGGKSFLENRAFSGQIGAISGLVGAFSGPIGTNSSAPHSHGGRAEIAPKGPFLAQLAPFGPSPPLLSPPLDFPENNPPRNCFVISREFAPSKSPGMKPFSRNYA